MTEQQIIQALIDRGHYLPELAARVHMDKKTVSRVWRGVTNPAPTERTLERIRDLGWVYGLTGSPSYENSHPELAGAAA